MKRIQLFLLFLLPPYLLIAQTIPPLEREVSISFQQERVEVVLTRLSKAADFTFSYNPSILEGSTLFDDSFSNKSVREILFSMFGETVQAKSKSNYIILTKAPASPKKTVEDNRVTISGYVIDEKTGEKISEASVYDKNSLTAAVTDQFGFFKVSIDKPSEEAILSFSKTDYRDTLIALKPGTVQFVNMSIAPKPSIRELVIEAKADSINAVTPTTFTPLVIDEPDQPRKKTFKEFMNEKFFSKSIFSKKKGGVNVTNIRDTIYRDFQVSFVPFVGTNHKLSGNVVNKYSFNILGGYSLGTSQAEFGGMFNIDRGDVKSAQFAGLFNTVGGTTHGVQMAGLGNMTRRSVHAAQFAGLFNTNLDSVRGPQFAGLFNANGGASQGAQFAGLFNVQHGNYRGGQFAGLLNTSTKQMTGTQFSGLINVANVITGAQVGFINYADSIQGVPVGFLSFVRRGGYHKFEVSADELFYINTALRTGVRKFYNIVAVGMKPETFNGSYATGPNPTQENVWSFGYGVGVAPKITKWMYLNIDLTANQVNKGSFTSSLNLLNKLYVGLDLQLAKKFSITAGVTLNGYLYDPNYADNPRLFTEYTPHIFGTHTFSNGNDLQMWWGAKIGLRFF